LDWESNQLFDFFGSKGRDSGVDLYLQVSDIRHCIHRQTDCGEDSNSDEEDRGQSNKCPLPNGKLEEAVEHISGNARPHEWLAIRSATIFRPALWPRFRQRPSRLLLR